MPRATTGIAYAVFGIVILGGLVFSVFVTVPAWAGVRAARVALAETREDLAKRQTFLKDIDARTIELATYDRDARVLAVAFPETEGTADLAAVLHGAAAASGVVLDQVSGAQQQKKAAAPPKEEPGDALAARSTSRESPAPAPAAKPSAGKASLPAYEVVLRGKGSYAQVRAFFREVERSLRLLDIARVEMRGGSDTTEQAGLVQFQTTVLFTLVEGS